PAPTEIYTLSLHDALPILYLIPIQQDFRSCIKNARLSKILEVQTEVQKTLDLRKDLHRTHSRFLYQTRILQIPLASLDESNQRTDRKSTRLNSSHVKISYA